MEISVIVPVYNVSSYLTRCLDSIIVQTFKAYDVILIDDGSTDNSGDICDRYAERHPAVHVIHQSNGGLSAARNAGIEWALAHSESRYITFIDSDDWVHPQYLERLHASIQTEGCGVSVGGFVKTDEETEFSVEQSHGTRVVSPSDFYCEHVVNFIVAWGKLYRKSDFAVLRFPEGKIHEDEFTTWKVLFKYERIAVIDLPIYAYFQREDSITNAQWNMEHLAGLEAMEEQKAWIDRNGNQRLKRYVRQRLTIVCAKLILGMKSIGADRRLISAYVKKLRYFIRDARPALPFNKYYLAYRVAWPIWPRVLIKARNIMHKTKALVSCKWNK